MGRFLLGRLLQAILALIFLSVLIFVLSRTLGSPLDTLIPVDAPPEVEERLIKHMGLDQPLYIQYATYMGQLLQGDLGFSIRSHVPVAELLAGRLFASMKLALVAIGFTLMLGFPAGVIAALNRGKSLDTMSKILALLGQSLPSFWVGILLIQLFSVKLELLPVSGLGGPAHYILPGFTMSLFLVAGVSRLLRTGMIEVLDSEFVRFARSKGVTERFIIWKHALRNAIVPVLGFGGVYFSILITMSIVVEVVFAWPGIGRLALNAISLKDFPVLQGVLLVTGVIVIGINFLVDFLYAFVDPRIRFSKI